jgi:IS1 family transposase
VSGKHIGASQLIEADSQHFYETMADACSVYRFNSYEYRCKVIAWLPKSSPVLTATAPKSSKTASRPTASRNTSVTLVVVKAAGTLLPMSTPKSARKRSCALIRSVRVLGDSGAPSASRPPRSSAGSKKAAQLELEDTLLFTEAETPPPVLELDELWSFVYRKSDKAWVWLALCRETRQVVAFVIGDRSRASCERYKGATCYSDFWEAYQGVLPEGQHEAVGKEEGETCHVERWINTLRQRLSRFVRKTLAFSKSRQMYHCCLKLFIYRYNLERRSIILQ